MEGTKHMNGLMRRALLAATATIATTMAIAAPASAGILTAAAGNCGDQTTSQPFTRWGDYANYKKVAGGSFEGSMTGWTLKGGAKVVSGNEPWKVGGASNAKSLSLPLGSTAISPVTCVGLAEPTLRFFAKKNSGLLTSLAVSVHVETSLGLVAVVPIGTILSNGTWQPSPRMLIVANLLPLLPGDQTPVKLQFTPVLGSWSIDDVYVDPMRYR
jgi:hypothetical protein